MTKAAAAGNPGGGSFYLQMLSVRRKSAYFPAFLIAACAAASLAMGTRNGLQET